MGGLTMLIVFAVLMIACMLFYDRLLTILIKQRYDKLIRPRLKRLVSGK